MIKIYLITFGLMLSAFFSVNTIKPEHREDGAKEKEVKAVEPNSSNFIAFEGAEGGGMKTTGGNKSGTVFFVNTLDDNEKGNISLREGSFRWCLNQPEPKIIFFKIAGVIFLKSLLCIPGNTTIAGQTAPGDGICIANNSVFVKGDNVIIRYLRFRLGDKTQIENDALYGKHCSDVIIDHCSISWSIDECSSFYSNTNFTMQWCILSESLRNSCHSKGAHGYGGIWGGKNTSFHHNLLAHHDSRNPRLCGSMYSNDPASELVDIRNNVIYNWGSKCGYGGEGGSFNFINNYYKPTVFTKKPNCIFEPNADNGENHQAAGVWGNFYFAGNYICGSSSVTNYNWKGVKPKGGFSTEKLRSEREFKVPYVTTQTAQEAYIKVLNLAGASLKRDATDKRIINEVKNGLVPVRASKGTMKGGFIDSQVDVGGWDTYSFNENEVPLDTDRDGMPDNWEISKGLPENDPSNANKYHLSSIFTDVEVYMNELAE